MFLADLWRIVWHWRLHLPFHHIPEVLYWCIRKARRIINDSSHPSPRLLSLLPSGRRLRSIWSRTNWLRDSFFPSGYQANEQSEILHPTAHSHFTVCHALHFNFYTFQQDYTHTLHCTLTLTQFKLDYMHTQLCTLTLTQFKLDYMHTQLCTLTLTQFKLDYMHTQLCTLTLTQFKLDYMHTQLCTLTFTLDYTHTQLCTLTLTQFKLDYMHTQLCTLTFTLDYTHTQLCTLTLTLTVQTGLHAHTALHFNFYTGLHAHTAQIQKSGGSNANPWHCVAYV